MVSCVSPFSCCTVLPLVFEPLPLGSIKPLGWMKDQLHLMADGLPGHLFDFYRLVKDAPWMGGNQEYSPLNEAFPYFFNGLVPLAYALDDERLKTQVLTAADYIIGHQHEDGWIGPECERDLSKRNFWGRYPLFLGLIQLIEVDSGRANTAIIPALHRFVELMHSMLSSSHKGYVWTPGDQFDEQWGRSRAADMIIALQWLYEKHPGNYSIQIHDCMVHLYEQAYDWSYWFSEDIFISDDLDLWPVELTNSLFPYIHGVNAGQGLKYGGVMRRLTHDDDLLIPTRNGVNWTFTYHGTPSGGIIGDEREAGLSPTRGVELCSVVETMFSLTYLQQSLGDRNFADRAELAAFNALPAMVRPHWWAHQYVAQTNQPISHPLPGKTPFWNVGPHGQVFGTEPNYPCCTVDFPQGYPKFLSASFVRSGDNGIAHALLIPGRVQTTTKDGTDVDITAETNYPFSQLLTYRIFAYGAFDFSFRVPGWTDFNTTRLRVNNRPSTIAPDDATGMHTVSLYPGVSTVEVELGASIRVEPRANDTIAIYHGALLYAVHVYHTATPKRPGRYPGTRAPEQASDWEMLPTSPWNLAIDPSTLSFFGFDNRDVDGGLDGVIWNEDAPPVMISALACEIEWGLRDGYAPDPPGRLVEVQGEGGGHEGQKPIDGPDGKKYRNGRKCIGRAFMVGLRPYGSAKLHMAELPTVDLNEGSADLWDPMGEGE
jgi:hypothetical protein